MVIDAVPGDQQARSDGSGGDKPETSHTTAVRYGQMGLVGEFTYQPSVKFACGTRVVVQTKRGIEIGEQISLTCPDCPSAVSRQQMMNFTSTSGAEYYSPDSGRVLREATADDLAEYDHILAGANEKRRLCQEFAARRSLEMKVVSCEPLFGGERIILYFVAEGRVDFRALVKDLAQEFQTRIEMRQVGARDEARLVADYETCGRECCCKNFLKNLKPVGMKMAKMQKATLDPSKVSGRCGRLKCCLRFEHSSYEELDRNLPRVGTEVGTSHGDGTVVARQILTQLVQVQTAAGGRTTVALEDLLKPGERPQPQAPPVESRTQPGTEAKESAPQGRSSGRGRGGRRRRAKSERQASGPRPVDKAAQPVQPPGDASQTPAAEPEAAPSPGAEKPRRPKRRRGRARPRGRRGKDKTGPEGTTGAKDSPSGGPPTEPSGGG